MRIPEVLPRNAPVEDWYETDLAWVAVAEAVLRLPGEGKGSDAEVAFARERGIPVFFSVAEVLAWASEKKTESPTPSILSPEEEVVRLIEEMHG